MLKPKFWHKKNSSISFFLLPISFFLQLLLFLKRNLIKKKIFSIKIICVGNIYLGGTGKTPLSIEIVKMLEKLKKKTALIKKIYKEHNDEFKLIESKEIKLFKNRSRASAIKEAEINKFDCVVLDDGLQDPSIDKNLNIVCFSESQLIGNGMTLPSGPLRENFSSLKKSQIVVINGNENKEFEKEIKYISKDICIFYTKYKPFNLDQFKELNLLAFAGIGNPDNFFDLLEKNNLKIIKKIAFPDHYNYSLKELNELINFSQKNNLKIITTEKDFFRIKHYNLIQIQCLRVKLEFENRNGLEKEIIKYL